MRDSGLLHSFINISISSMQNSIERFTSPKTRYGFEVRKKKTIGLQQRVKMNSLQTAPYIWSSNRSSRRTYFRLTFAGTIYRYESVNATLQ